MKIGHFNTFPYGGAATAARRLHQGLRELDVESLFYFWQNDRERLDASYRQLHFQTADDSGLLAPLQRQRQKFRQRKIKSRYDRHIRPRSTQLEVFSAARLLKETRIDPLSFDGDIAHLHWMAFFVDYPSFLASIPEHVPIVWTLHDMNPLTGGCHYSSGCTRFVTGCGSCPQLANAHPQDESSKSFRVKRKALANRNLTVVTPTNWMQELAKSSAMFGDQTRFETIQYGLDLDAYRPIDKQLARRQLGIGLNDDLVIGFGAEDINHHRKGYWCLSECLNKLNGELDLKCLVFGGGEVPPSENNQHQVYSLGFLESAAHKALVYSAMDCFVLPSLEDNSPQTALEAMACGTPVAAFNAGGISELIRNNFNGHLSPVADTGHLAATILHLAADRPALDRMAAHARQHVMANHCLHQQAFQYLELYQDLLKTELPSNYENYAVPPNAA